MAQQSQVTTNLRLRRSFGKIKKIIDIPNLIEIQKRSYDEFLQADAASDQRTDSGLQGVFKSVFPIKDFNENASLEFVSYELGLPKYDVDECHQRGMTFAAPIKVKIQLVIWDTEGGHRSIKNVKEQEVYFGEIPLMTPNGTFMINGTERVIVSQLHRSPGVFFEHDKGKTHSTGKLLYSARIIPYRGSWIDFEFDPRDVLYVRIDRRRKFPATVLLRALGNTTEDLLNYYYKKDVLILDGKSLAKQFKPDHLLGSRVSRDVKDPKTGETLAREGRKFNRAVVRQMEQARIEEVPIAIDEMRGRISAHDIADPATGEILLRINEELTDEKVEELRTHEVKRIEVLYTEDQPGGGPLRLTLLQDKLEGPDDAIIEIYKRLRPGDPPTKETATAFFNNLFFNPERYDLSKVGRLKLNHKLFKDEKRVPLEQGTLRREDILEVVRYLLELKNGNGQIDDIDHLGNRRVRAVGELVENQFRIGLVRMERAIKERMSLQDIETLMPQELVNYKPAAAVIKEFFGSSQLSQFMDQTNPLSEIAHKRRLSALGPGGLTRERAGFEVRDVHPTHYGRVCPIETPEGPNIGLIAALSTYARVNEYGFIETPYRVVEAGRVTDRIVYLSALGEEQKPDKSASESRAQRDTRPAVIAQANAPLDAHGRFTSELVSARIGGEFTVVRPEEVDYMDVSPNQLVSVAASLIPFLENDDANRALMGSNMQRQAVPLLKTDAPLVGTGLEKTVGRDSGVTVLAKRDGTVESVDAERIVIRADRQSRDPRDAGVDIYNLIKYQRSNQNTCINQRPVVVKTERVKAGDVIADGPSTDAGELALGRNVLVAFMPWGGYNFEDSILISERVVKEDLFTSVHIEEFECIARDTKLGQEEITRDIPNVGEEALRDLDTSGIIRIGAEVRPGDILVGKITPKGETQLSPEEKLLRAIFGEKAGEVRDTSLRVPPGVEGTVINARVFSRRGVAKDDRTQEIEQTEVERLKLDEAEEVRIIRQQTARKLKRALAGKELAGIVRAEDRHVVLPKGHVLTAEDIDELPTPLWGSIKVENEAAAHEHEQALEAMEENVKAVSTHYGSKMDRLKAGDELPAGVIKMIKVFVAIKRRLQVGDKMAGRHGNKGVLSRILPAEDMPYLADGTPVDIVLNPLGVPSRMNVGQILETHLGWAARELGALIERDLRNSVAPAQVRKRLLDIYAGKENQEFIESLSDADALKLAAKCVTGIHLASPVFDGAREEEIFQMLKRASLPDSGQCTLFDGRNGLPFEQAVTVGVMYMMKLHHLVEDKIHARSTGPYSLVTQQPLGGKAQFGGQRLGEMEVWALEAYGAAYALQEMLTVKSDDVAGRTRMYEAIVKGENTLEPGLPESFNVMVKELQSLCLNVDLLEEAGRV
ncbi:MAG TPA: DNA-directed RNA polymerase subunit beta [Candidatus Binataceae bacterium]|jgi:DNA-directed RNA polymerase subunit beta|nr:DNA-directed RNA polymerase subunit beta [Candidatus Binataceae bacterium]HZY58212.1 DNA-directed RNA polymerase subunit beta [Candidatus Binataceae bacterium]